MYIYYSVKTKTGILIKYIFMLQNVHVLHFFDQLYFIF